MLYYDHTHHKMAKTTKDIFKEFYPKLLKILPIDCVINHLYSKKLLSSAHKSKLQDMPTTRERTKCFLDEVIERGLEVDCMSQFDEMLAVMANSDDPPVKFLANEMMKCEIASNSLTHHGQSCSLQTRSQNTESHKLELNSSKALIRFSKDGSINAAYNKMTSNIAVILETKNIKFNNLRRACIQEIHALGSTLPKSLVHKIQPTRSLDELLDVLVPSPYWNWFDTRLLQALVSASGSLEAEEWLEIFKKTFYAKKIIEVIPYISIKPFKESVNIVEKFDKDPKDLSISDLLEHKYKLENEVLDIDEGELVLSCIRTGCVELTWQIPTELVYRAYTSMKRKHDELSSLSVKSLDCEKADEYAGLPILWRGQEVGEVGPIEPLPEHVRQEPYSLPQGFHWVSLQSSDVEEVLKFINRCDDYKVDKCVINFFIKYPNTKDEWQFGIKTTTGELIGLVLAYPICVNIGGVSLTYMKSFIDYHNGKRLYYVLTKELMRRANLYSINHRLILFKHCDPFKPITTPQIWKYNFDDLTNTQLPSSPRTPGLRRMTSEDVPSALALINKWSSQFEIRQVFNSEEEVAYNLLCSNLPNYVFTYVVENKVDNITDLISFKLINKMDMVFSILIAASTQTPIEKLLIDALVCAKKLSGKILIIDTLNIKPDILFSLSFHYEGPHYFSIYNYRYHETSETSVWIMM